MLRVAAPGTERVDGAPLMSRIDRVTTMPAWPLGYPKPDYYLVDARGAAGAIAANRLLTAGLSVDWTSGMVTQDGATYRPGTLIVRPVKQAKPVVERLGREMGLRVFGARGRMPASRYS